VESSKFLAEPELTGISKIFGLNKRVNEYGFIRHIKMKYLDHYKANLCNPKAY
jgi:hypothetical protein